MGSANTNLVGDAGVGDAEGDAGDEEPDERDVQPAQDVPELLGGDGDAGKAEEVHAGEGDQHHEMAPLLHVPSEDAQVLRKDGADRAEAAREQAFPGGGRPGRPGAGRGRGVEGPHPATREREVREHTSEGKAGGAEPEEREEARVDVSVEGGPTGVGRPGWGGANRSRGARSQ